MAPDEGSGLPGVPGSGSSGSSGSGLPGIPGSGPTSGGAQPPAPQPAPIPGESAFATPAPPAPPAGGATFVQPGPPPVDAPVYELAGWGRRVAATLIDVLVLVVIFVPLFAIAATIGLDTGSSSSGDGSFEFSARDGQVLGILFISWIAMLLYAPTAMAITNGSTLGKLAVGIRVVRVSGEKMSFGWAALREVIVKQVLFGTISTFTIGLATLLDYLWPLWDAENRALHDMVVKTRVVRR